MSIIKVYSTQTCSYCKLAKQKLTELGLDYIEVSLDNPEDFDLFKQEYPTVTTVPQIIVYYDEECEKSYKIGGYTDLIRYINNDMLNDILQNA